MSEGPLFPKQVYFPQHAEDRMRERHFSREDVRRILFTGTVAQSSYQKPGGPFRHAREMRFGNRLARVVFISQPMRYIIVTVEWVDE